ncbi:MAG: CsgG/HfaB family protein [Pseudoxanthomonas suwonensis]|nr:CsgG/HfaB family protein [Pseudoxanthomonas suwonensis]
MNIACNRGALVAALAAGVAAALCAAPAHAQRGSAQQQRAQQMNEIPVCSRNLGSISVMEAEGGRNWWSGQQLPAPSALIKVFVNRSRCFTLVDRGRGLGAAMGERELGASGQLRNRSNIGAGQMRAADYVMIPDLISRNSNAGGSGVGGLLGGLIGGRAGAVVGGLNVRSSSADVVLTVTDVRSTEQVAMAEGSARKNDLSWRGGGALFGSRGIGGAGLSGYTNTEIGQVITLAYLDAYTRLVQDLGGLSGNPAASNVHQAVTMIRPGRLLANPAGTGRAVRDLDVGMMLYPTGNKEGMMWEVEDELGNRGWVSSSLVELSK